VATTPDWDSDGAGWPLREHSRFVRAGGLRWHVQLLGSGPPLLLLHGAGGATHSWSRLAPLLAPRFTLVAPDLPGHGFTGTPPGERLTLPGVAALVSSLLTELGVAPALVDGKWVV
jgi:magnesium chelatase accessory protein